MKQFLRQFFHPFLKSMPVRLLINLLIVYAAYFICRLAFLFENWETFSSTLTTQSLLRIFTGGFVFDSSAIFYTNVLFMVLFIATAFFRHQARGWYQSILKWLYVIINSLCVVINLADSVFFVFRLQRSSFATITEFQNEGNLATIGGIEIIRHWYFIILAAMIIYGLYKLYLSPFYPDKKSWRYYLANGLCVILYAYLTVSGMRGGWLFAGETRPIAVGYAQKFVDRPVQTGIVLNTPFSIFRTAGQSVMAEPHYFTESELDKIYSPLHIPSDTLTLRRKNVVILIVESFASEFIGGLNRDLDNGTYKGYTPFADSLLDVSAHWKESFANAGFSIDSPPAVLASIPRMRRPFLVSPHSMNDINSIASILKPQGYSTAFFHGASKESLGFNAFTHHAGFEKYYSRDEFYADPRFGGEAEFDGTWGVWDEPFLQYFAAKLGEMPQPFLASVFTLSSHHPFKLPEKYKDVFPDEGLFPIHKCIRYADLSLRRFFETAAKQPWYDNTIFVVTADHASSRRTHDEYKTELGAFRIPILIFDPSGELPRGELPGISQQTDIMPTILNYLGNKTPYISFGIDLFNTPADDTWAFNWEHLPQYIKGDYLLQTSGEEISGFYNYRRDPLLKENLMGKGIPEENEMLISLKALLQSYIHRMNTNDVTTQKQQTNHKQ